jgi:hypothetical protein
VGIGRARLIVVTATWATATVELRNNHTAKQLQRTTAAYLFFIATKSSCVNGTCEGLMEK